MREKKDVLNKLNELLIPTDVVDSIYTVIKACSAGPADLTISQQFWLILGPSGVGKTFAIKHSFSSTDIGDRTENSTVLYFSASETFTPRDICNTILYKLGEKIPNRLSLDCATSLVKQQLKAHEVRALIVDDIQRLLHSGQNSARARMEFLIDLANKNNISIIGSGTPEALRLLELDVPNKQSFSVINVAPLKYDEKFLSVLKAIEEQIDAPFPIFFSDTISMVPEFLFEVSDGLFGNLIGCIYEVFSHLGLHDNKTELSQMKVTKEVIIAACLCYSGIDLETILSSLS